MKTLIIALITLYQRTISPDHGIFKARWPHGFCRFYPSCSEYTKQAVLAHGAIKGLLLGAARILRCNPFTQPRVDTIS
jgi:putative membrane protein insertion efficiency factor